MVDNRLLTINITMKSLQILKIISVVVFLSITKSGQHISLPIFIGLLSGFLYFFKNPLNHIPSILTVTGLVIIIISCKRHLKTHLVTLAYLITYIIPIMNLMDKRMYNFEKQWFFFLSTFIYFIISIYVIFKSYKLKL